MSDVAMHKLSIARVGASPHRAGEACVKRMD
jgi:hypothetical protein